MNNLIHPISEDNIFENITILRKSKLTSIDIFDSLHNNLPQDWGSIEKNYLPLFIYDLIVNKTDLKEFEDTIVHIYQLDSKNDLEYIFNRFFNERDTNVSLDFFEKNPNDKSISIWDKLSYLFFTVKNDHIGIKNETLPYLETMLKHVSNSNIGGLYGGSFNTMIYSLYHNFEDTIPLLKVINNNEAYKKYDPPNHYDFLTHAVYYMDSCGYQLPKDIKERVYNTYSTYCEKFKEAFEHKLINFSSSEKRFQFGYGIANYICCIGDKAALNIIDKTYKKATIDFYEDTYFIDNTWRERNQKPLLIVPFYDLASKINISLKIFLKDVDLEPDCSQIDINQTLYYNFVHLKVLEKSISKNDQPHISIEIRKYIIDTLHATEEQYEFGEKLLDSNTFKTYFSYLTLNEKIEDKPNKNHIKKKI